MAAASARRENLWLLCQSGESGFLVLCLLLQLVCQKGINVSAVPKGPRVLLASKLVPPPTLSSVDGADSVNSKTSGAVTRMKSDTLWCFQ